MRIISQKKLRQFSDEPASASRPLLEWYSKTLAARWTSFVSVKQTFGQTDQTKVRSGNTVTIFDIGGNKFRLIAAIHDNTGIVYVLRIMTHAEYDRAKWKDDL